MARPGAAGIVVGHYHDPARRSGRQAERESGRSVTALRLSAFDVRQPRTATPGSMGRRDAECRGSWPVLAPRFPGKVGVGLGSSHLEGTGEVVEDNTSPRIFYIISIFDEIPRGTLILHILPDRDNRPRARKMRTTKKGDLR